MKNAYISIICLTMLLSTGDISPNSITSYNIIETNLINQIDSYLAIKDYERAYLCLHNYCINDSLYFHINKDKYQKLLDKYKEILFIKCHSYELAGQLESAQNILIHNQNFYKDDLSYNEYLSKINMLINDKNLVVYDGPIPHLHFNPLLAFPKIALSPNNPYYNEFDNEYITPDEFNNILLQLYHNNYILVRLSSLYNNNQISTLKLPQGKKPIVLSFDNVCYPSKYKSKGLIDKIIIDRNNKIASYTGRKSIQDRVDYNNEFITILENFIKKHQDFSFEQARGTIILSGHSGILGYDTNRKNLNSKFEKSQVTEVITRLKQLGWEFGSMGYDTITSDNNELELAKSLSNFDIEVRSIISTNIFALTNKPQDKYLNQLIDYNYQLVLYDDNQPNLYQDNNIIYMTRQKIDGSHLRKNKEYFNGLFDANLVYDHQNRITPFINE